jgi:Tfp pilus assembly protein PilF
VAVTLLAFAPVVGIGYVDFDDDEYVSANPHIQQGVNPGSLRWAFTSFYAANWHPITWLSHMLDWQVYGPSPMGHHVTSVLIHLASVLILFFSLERMTGAVVRSAFAAALFAVHPLHVESVAWLAERKDVLCAFFWFLAIAAYAKGVERPKFNVRLTVFLFTALALMSKPMAVTLPLTLLLLDAWPLEGKRSLTVVAAVREKVPLFVLSAAAAWLTVLAQHAVNSIVTVASLPPGQRLGNAVVTTVAYLVKTAWPVRLAAFYPHPAGTLSAWTIAGAVGLILVVSALALWLRRERPYLLFGWAWYLITLIPVIGLVQVGEQGMADRYTYIPLVGIFIALSWGAGDLVTALAARGGGRRIDRPAVAVGFAVVLVLVGVTRFQIGFWKDGVTLFTRALEVTEGNVVAHAKLGQLLTKEGKPDAANPHYREAVRLSPDSALAHMDLGSNLLQLGGRPDEALVQFEEAIRADAGFAEAHDRAATVLSQLGRHDEAYAHFAEAVRIDPTRADFHYNWGTALASQSRYRESAMHFSEATRLAPTMARAHFNLAAASFFLDDYSGAWREVALARANGLEPPPGFLSMLSAKMPEPR